MTKSSKSPLPGTVADCARRLDSRRRLTRSVSSGVSEVAGGPVEGGS